MTHIHRSTTFLAWVPTKFEPGEPEAIWEAPENICSHPYAITGATKALQAEYGQDAHFVTGVVYKDGRPLPTQPRLLKGCLKELRERGYEVLHHVLAVDVDRLMHAPMNDESRADACDRLAKVPHIGFYTTRGGLRVLRTLKNPLTPEQWEVLCWNFRCEIQVAMGDDWDADKSCKDWTRHFRLGRVIRDKKSTKAYCVMDLSRMQPVDNEVPEVEPEAEKPHFVLDAGLLAERRAAGDHPKALKALENGAAELQDAAFGTRHRTLIRVAYSIGGYVGGGYLDRDLALNTLLAAIAHYDGKNDEKKLTKCLDTGALEPRTIEEVDPDFAAHLQELEQENELLESILSPEEFTQESEAPMPDWNSLFIFNGKGKNKTVKGNPHNIRVYLENHPGWKKMLAYDEFTDCVVWGKNPPSGWTKSYPETSKTKQGDTWTDEDTTRLIGTLNRMKMDVRPDAVNAVISVVAKTNVKHSLRDYLRSLKHDGKKRLDTWLTRYAGVEATPYSQKVSRWTLGQAVKMVMSPGSIAKYVLTLEGPQDIGKSRLIRALASLEYYSDAKIEPGSRDSSISLKGKWIIELAEGEILTRAGLEALKAWIGTPQITYTPKYANRPITVPRQDIEILTINPGSNGTYLQDQTGNVRFWPVVCTTCDVDALIKDRDQLWAEAVAAYDAGEVFYPQTIEDKKLFREEVSERVVTDVWDDLLGEKLSGVTETTVAEVLTDYLGYQLDRIVAPLQNRATASLGRLGFKRGDKRVLHKGVKTRLYSRDPSDAKALELSEAPLSDAERQIIKVLESFGRTVTISSDGTIHARPVSEVDLNLEDVNI